MAGFDFSPSDVVPFGQFKGKIISADEFIKPQRATKPKSKMQMLPEHVWKINLYGNPSECEE